MHTRSATLVAVALSLLSSPAPASAQGARAALVKQSDIIFVGTVTQLGAVAVPEVPASDRTVVVRVDQVLEKPAARSEEHTSELQSPCNLVCRLLLEKKKKKNTVTRTKIKTRAD